MAELLIRVVDKISADAENNELLTKSGDVVCVCPDGWPWSEVEKTNQEWRIVRLPGVALSALADMLEPEMGANSTPVRKRSRGFSTNSSAFKDIVASTVPVTLSGGALTAFLAARKTKLSRGNKPVVLG